jgi:hypothetical protein
MSNIRRKIIILEVKTTATHAEILSRYFKGSHISLASLCDTTILQCQVNKVAPEPKKGKK